MSPGRHRVVLGLSVLLLVGVGAAWLAWPERTARADLRAVAPIPTTSTSTSTTTSTTSRIPTMVTSAPRPLEPSLLHPARVRIASIGVDARVVAVGLTPDQQMELPPATDVGWYQLGPAPGQGGSAVLAAHIDLAGRKGAFSDLASVPIGAEVIVDGDGTSRRFTVTAREQVAKQDVRFDRHFTTRGPARLTLITCGGVFDAGASRYADNLIITAELVA